MSPLLRLCEKFRSWKEVNCSNQRLQRRWRHCTAEANGYGTWVFEDRLLTDELCLYGSWLNIVQEELEAELDQTVEAFPRIESKWSTICMWGTGGKWDTGLKRSSSEVLLEFEELVSGGSFTQIYVCKGYLIINSKLIT